MLPSCFRAVHTCLWMPEGLEQTADLWTWQELVWKNLQGMEPSGSLTTPVVPGLQGVPGPPAALAPLFTPPK